MKEKLKKAFQFIANPHLLLCLLIAWLITNGWSYIMLALGTYFKIEWMSVLSGAYITFLWFPMSPEHLVTIAIAIALLRLFFPDDKKTLYVLRQLHAKAKETIEKKKKKSDSTDNDN